MRRGGAGRRTGLGAPRLPRLRDYAIERAGLSPRQLQDLAHVNAALRELPGVERTFAAGRLTWTKARLLCRVATPEDEGCWLEAAEPLTARELAREVRAPLLSHGPGERVSPARFVLLRYGRVASNHAEFSSWLVGSLRTGLIAIDEESCVALISPEAVRVLELGDEAPQLGRPAAEVLAPHPALLTLLAEAQKGHELPSRAELELVLAGGRERRPIGFTLVPVRDPHGSPRGAALLFRDLTPFERHDEQARLRDRLAALGQMAAGLAHEIRNPLASLQVLADLLKRSLGERPSELELVEEIRGELESLTRLVNGSLAFVRPHAAMRAPVELAELIGEALGRARARVPFDGAVELEVQAGLRPSLDALQLESMLVNLIVNAFDAMQGAPADRPRLLRIEASEQGGELRLAVADSGPGVPIGDRERIFYPFFTTRDQGTGVGLAEVHKAVVSHGGSVEVRERVGGGAVFLIHLPLEERT